MSSRRPSSAVLTLEQERVLTASVALTKGWGAYLAGGLGVALHLGHRRSADFDWFTPRTLPPSEVLTGLRSTALPVNVRQNDEGTFHGTVAGVDYSVFRYPYPLIKRSVSIAGVDVASLHDIAAMKMTAIVQRATKRDYVDLHTILASGEVRLGDLMIATMRQKFAGYDPSLSLRALTYFRDVEAQAMPVMIAKTTWENVKRELTRVRDRDVGRGGLSR